jgi:2,4-dienoyl-CoA reductase (NADPH2)
VRRYTIDTPYPVGPVHIYLLEQGGRLVLFDAGPPTFNCFNFLKNNLPLSKIEYVFITHAHADHCGATGFIRENSEAKIVIPRKDILKNMHFEEIKASLKGILLDLGFPKEVVMNMQNAVESLKTQENLPEDVLAVEDINLPEDITYKPFPGHSITDFVYLVDNKYAFTGDFLLADIFQTPLIEIDPETGEVFDNYRAYCNSIARLSELEGYEVLPSHRELKHPLDAVGFYVDKLIKRSRFVRECLQKNCTIFDAVKELLDPYKEPFKAYMKASELVFIRDFIQKPELLLSSLKKIGLFDRFEKAVEGIY